MPLNPASVGTIDAVNSQVALSVAGLDDAIFFFAPLGNHAVAFEQSFDTTNGSDGTWYPAEGNMISGAGAGTSVTLTTTLTAYRVATPAASMVRARVTTQTTAGAIGVQAFGVKTTAPPANIGATPTGPLLAGGNLIGSMRIGGTSLNGYSLVTAATTNAALVKSASAVLTELAISNPTATAVFVKLYNKATAPTVGTDVPVLTLRVDAAGGVADFREVDFGANGKLFSLGLGIAVTAAAAATDATAAVAGVQVHGTYV